MISLRNVEFSYGERPVLRNITFDVRDNESLIIMGPSGSGKSTILRLLLGLEFPQRGEVIVDGVDMAAVSEVERQEVRKNIGMVFQDGALFDSLTVWENVGYYLLEHTRMDYDEVTERVVEMLGFVGLDPGEVLHKLPEQLSGGMQRRVAIGRALLSTDPSVMLFDEPTTGLDPQSTATVIALINKLRREKNISNIVVTHQIADAISLADRFMVIVAGEKAYDGTVQGLRESDDPRVREFLGPFRQSLTEVVARHFM